MVWRAMRCPSATSRRAGRARADRGDRPAAAGRSGDAHRHAARATRGAEERAGGRAGAHPRAGHPRRADRPAQPARDASELLARDRARPRRRAAERGRCSTSTTSSASTTPRPRRRRRGAAPGRRHARQQLRDDRRARALGRRGVPAADARHPRCGMRGVVLDRLRGAIADGGFDTIAPALKVSFSAGAAELHTGETQDAAYRPRRPRALPRQAERPRSRGSRLTEGGGCQAASGVGQVLGHSTHSRSGCFMRPACASAASPQPQK